MVQLLGKGIGYQLSQPVVTNAYVLDSSTLKPLRSGSFSGFRPGERLLLAIGLSTNGPEKEDFWVSWVGQIEVK